MKALTTCNRIGFDKPVDDQPGVEARFSAFTDAFMKRRNSLKIPFEQLLAVPADIS